MKAHILSFAAAFSLLAAFLLRLFFPGTAFLWPLIYLLPGIAALLWGIMYKHKEFALITAQIFFALFISLAAAESFFQLKNINKITEHTKFPGKRIWWDNRGSSYVLRNGKKIPLLSGEEALDPNSKITIFRPRTYGIHRSSRILADGKTVVTFEAEYTINEHGFRKVPFHNTPSPRKPLLFFGDSFTFGEGVNDDEVYVNLVAEELKEKRYVFNYAMPGTDPADFLYFLTHGYLDRCGLKGDLNTQAFYLIINDHKFRVIHAHSNREDRFFSKQDRLFRSISYWLKERFFYKSAVCDAVINSIYSKRYLIYLQKARKFLKEKHGTELVIVLYPDCTKAVRNDLVKAGFKLLFLDKLMPGYSGSHGRTIDLKYEIPNDGHPTPETHKIIAEAIVQYLQKGDSHPQSAQIKE